MKTSANKRRRNRASERPQSSGNRGRGRRNRASSRSTDEQPTVEFSFVVASENAANRSSSRAADELPKTSAGRGRGRRSKSSSSRAADELPKSSAGMGRGRGSKASSRSGYEQRVASAGRGQRRSKSPSRSSDELLGRSLVNRRRRSMSSSRNANERPTEEFSVAIVDGPSSRPNDERLKSPSNRSRRRSKSSSRSDDERPAEESAVVAEAEGGAADVLDCPATDAVATMTGPSADNDTLAEQDCKADIEQDDEIAPAADSRDNDKSMEVFDVYDVQAEVDNAEPEGSSTNVMDSSTTSAGVDNDENDDENPSLRVLAMVPSNDAAVDVDDIVNQQQQDEGGKEVAPSTPTPTDDNAPATTLTVVGMTRGAALAAAPSTEQVEEPTTRSAEAASPSLRHADEKPAEESTVVVEGPNMAATEVASCSARDAKFHCESMSRATARVLSIFRCSISAMDVDQELASIVTVGVSTSGSIPNMDAVKVFFWRRGFSCKEREHGVSKWAALRHSGDPLLLLFEVQFKDKQGSLSHTVVYHKKILQDHMERGKPFQVTNADISRSDKAGTVFDKFFKETPAWRNSYLKCKLTQTWLIKKINARWRDYHRESLPGTVAMIVSDLDGSIDAIDAQALRNDLAAITAAVAENNATGAGGLGMEAVQGFLANKGFACEHVGVEETDGKWKMLRRASGFYLLILSVFLEARDDQGEPMYQKHAMYYNCNKLLLWDSMTTDESYRVTTSDLASSKNADSVFDSHFTRVLFNSGMNYKHCILIDAWEISKPSQQISRRNHWKEHHPSTAKGSEQIRSLLGKRVHECDSEEPSSEVPGPLSERWEPPERYAKRGKLKGPYVPITGEYTSIPDALKILLRKLNIKADDIPHRLLNHDRWVPSVKKYIKLPVARYLDSKGLKLEALPQGILNNHYNILIKRNGNFLIIMTLEFEADKHGPVPRATHALVWLAKEGLLIDNKNMANPVRVTGRDMWNRGSAKKVFDNYLSSLCGDNTVYKLSLVRCAYQIKKCFSQRPAADYFSKQKWFDGWVEEAAVAWSSEMAGEEGD